MRSKTRTGLTRGWFLPVASVASVACLLVGSVVEAGELKRYEFSRQAMGVRFRIVVYAAEPGSANSASKAALDRVAVLEKVFSDYDSGSETMRLCAAARVGKPIAAGVDLRRVLSRSLEISRQSRGAFDVTVGPLTRLWRRARRRKKLPSARRLAEARRSVGFTHLAVDKPAGTVTLARKGMRLDFGGIAKGYAADEALAILRRHGLPRALVDGSGDIALGDPPPGRAGWRVAVGSLRNPDATPLRMLELANTAVATSGDAYQSITIDGRRYSHILDPRTGLGLQTPSSVTVIASDATTADALASAISVLGPRQGVALADRLCGVEALYVTRQDKELNVARSRGWKDLPPRRP